MSETPIHQEYPRLREQIGKEPDTLVFADVHFPLHPDVLQPAIVYKIGNAQEMEVRSFVPLVRQHARYGGPSPEEYLEPGFVIGEI